MCFGDSFDTLKHVKSAHHLTLEKQVIILVKIKGVQVFLNDCTPLFAIHNENN